MFLLTVFELLDELLSSPQQNATMIMKNNIMQINVNMSLPALEYMIKVISAHHIYLDGFRSALTFALTMQNQHFSILSSILPYRICFSF